MSTLSTLSSMLTTVLNSADPCNTDYMDSLRVSEIDTLIYLLEYHTSASYGMELLEHHTEVAKNLLLPCEVPLVYTVFGSNYTNDHIAPCLYVIGTREDVVAATRYAVDNNFLPEIKATSVKLKCVAKDQDKQRFATKVTKQEDIYKALWANHNEMMKNRFYD